MSRKGPRARFQLIVKCRSVEDGTTPMGAPATVVQWVDVFKGPQPDANRVMHEMRMAGEELRVEKVPRRRYGQPDPSQAIRRALLPDDEAEG